MFIIKGRLKVALLVVGVLVVGLGMYAGFQVQEAEAHSWLCRLRKHKTKTSEESIAWEKTTESNTFYTNCSNCTGSPKKTHVEWKWYYHYYETVKYYHGNSYCHKHGPNRKKSTYWRLEKCGG
ncbi:hypothetical protein F4X33_10075 [Candidatus Poribacteria bacterium]|nr:hypothetical protein [Candidatus Poribacteria bacterium]